MRVRLRGFLGENVNRFVSALALLIAGLGAQGAAAQHATAFDVEDGRRVYQASCANCHGPDGNLIASIDFGRGEPPNSIAPIRMP